MESDDEEADEKPEGSGKIVELHSPELVLDTSAPEIKMNITTKSGEPVRLWKLSGIWLLVFQRAGDSKDTGYRSAQWNRAGRSGGS